MITKVRSAAVAAFRQEVVGARCQARAAGNIEDEDRNKVEIARQSNMKFATDAFPTIFPSKCSVTTAANILATSAGSKSSGC